MATMTISYDGRNRTARAIVDMIRSLDIFSVTESPSKEDLTLMTKDEYFAMLDQRAAEYEQGKYHTYSSVEELDRHIRSL